MIEIGLAHSKQNLDRQKDQNDLRRVAAGSAANTLPAQREPPSPVRDVSLDIRPSKLAGTNTENNLAESLDRILAKTVHHPMIGESATNRDLDLSIQLIGDVHRPEDRIGIICGLHR